MLNFIDARENQSNEPYRTVQHMHAERLIICAAWIMRINLLPHNEFLFIEKFMFRKLVLNFLFLFINWES